MLIARQGWLYSGIVYSEPTQEVLPNMFTKGMAVRLSADLGLHITHSLLPREDYMRQDELKLRHNVFWAVFDLDT